MSLEPLIFWEMDRSIYNCSPPHPWQEPGRPPRIEYGALWLWLGVAAAALAWRRRLAAGQSPVSRSP